MLKLQTSNNELQHHGVKGMKWGVRRTPAQLGHPTATKKRKTKADKSRIEKAYANYKKKKAEKKKEEEKTAYKRKTAKEMTDEELVKAINRARLEDQYRAMRPEPVSKGKKIADTMMNKVIGPAATEAGKRALTNTLNKMSDNLLRDAADPITSEINNLRRQSELLGLRNDVQNLRRGLPPVRNWQDAQNSLNYENDRNRNSNDLPPVRTWQDVLNRQTYERNNRTPGNGGNTTTTNNDRGFDVEAANRAFQEWRQNRRTSENMQRPVSDIQQRTIDSGRTFYDNLLENVDQI